MSKSKKLKMEKPCKVTGTFARLSTSLICHMATWFNVAEHATLARTSTFLADIVRLPQAWPGKIALTTKNWALQMHQPSNVYARLRPLELDLQLIYTSQHVQRAYLLPILDMTTLQRLSISHASWINNETVKAVLTNKPNLQQLQLQGGYTTDRKPCIKPIANLIDLKELQRLDITCDMYVEDLRTILICSPQLNHLSLHRVEWIDDQQGNGLDASDERCFETAKCIGNVVRNLTSFEWRRPYDNLSENAFPFVFGLAGSKLRKLTFDILDPAILGLLPASLEELHLYATLNDRPGLISATTLECAARLHGLVKLVVQGGELLDDVNFRTLCNMANLREMRLIHVEGCSVDILASLFIHLEHLEHALFIHLEHLEHAYVAHAIGQGDYTDFYMSERQEDDDSDFEALKVLLRETPTIACRNSLKSLVWVEEGVKAVSLKELRDLFVNLETFETSCEYTP